ncbi:MAG: Thiol peroxidase, Bcp-type [uncultured Rubrobacteraceae bacterium]|uniref:Thiol peroxidase, Bcp-type n=1 Tax=uncultured Rubrobacteraceae bacterium TaxID=349277 RepID=A0A6J4QS87_9ACTN|nr:MAG: Thiol peroxidase, Bcp-type [uncultured Rubrobacteraceae bacterium]
MRKIVLLATAALVAMLILVPTAIAQESTLPASGGQTLPASGGQTSDPLPASGGLTAPSALLPAAALIMGSGIVAYAIVRRR